MSALVSESDTWEDHVIVQQCILHENNLLLTEWNATSLSPMNFLPSDSRSGISGSCVIYGDIQRGDQ